MNLYILMTVTYLRVTNDSPEIFRDQIFYLMSRGYTVSDALSMVVEGFMDSFIKELARLEMEHPGFNYLQDLK
jgi:hypothetical protein